MSVAAIDLNFRRVRGMYMDILMGDSVPKAGDRLDSGKTVYLVLRSRKVNRHDSQSAPRYQMRVIRLQDCPTGFSSKMIGRAIRQHGSSIKFDFQWYPRQKRTFESYMRRSVCPVTS